MKFSQVRDTLIKYIDDDVDHDNPATPRWLSPYRSGFLIAKGRDETPFRPVQRKRASRVRKRLPGVSIPKAIQPWRAK
ncbi:hypothetical protein PBI_GAIA_138 [Mycobacterium phage Gaia]|uniref:Uncharacterized protein n=1 Tax=Mycobacterium phage Gaia TaxID=1486472 RepID=A0A068F1Y3_9CAUD|nr:hypothetical protein VC46_gp095 [Mycobacterium phage Gaia]AID58957.1 hypothetical protein PBI_GAIA_138 [Mycobacterium phage Gaia]